MPHLEERHPPQQNFESFENNGWLPDGNIEWIDSAYRDDVKLLLSANEWKDVGTDDSDLQDDNDC